MILQLKIKTKIEERLIELLIKMLHLTNKISITVI